MMNIKFVDLLSDTPEAVEVRESLERSMRSARALREMKEEYAEIIMRCAAVRGQYLKRQGVMSLPVISRRFGKLKVESTW